MSSPSTYQEFSLISEPEASQSKLSFAYLMGFLLADGSFQISFQKNNTFRSKFMIIAKLSFSQTINTEKAYVFLEVLKESLEDYNLSTGKIRVYKRQGSLDVWGALNFRKFKELMLNQNVLTVGTTRITPLAGIRYRDFLILEAVEVLRQQSVLLTDYGLMLALRLRYNLHCPDKYGILPPVRGQRKSYEEAVVHYASPANIDYVMLAPRLDSEADNILSEIDQKVQEQHRVITHSIMTSTLTVNPWFVTGFFEGDGCSTVSVVFNEYNKVSPKILVSMVSHRDNRIVLEIIQYFFKQPNFNWPEEVDRNFDFIYDKKQEPHSILRFFSLYFFNDVLAPFFKEYPLQTIKYKRINMCYNLVMQYTTDQLNNVENLICVVKSIYQTPTAHNAEKARIPLAELIDRIYALSEQTETPSRISSLSRSLPDRNSLPKVVELGTFDLEAIPED